MNITFSSNLDRQSIYSIDFEEENELQYAVRIIQPEISNNHLGGVIKLVYKAGVCFIFDNLVSASRQRLSWKIDGAQRFLTIPITLPSKKDFVWDGTGGYPGTIRAHQGTTVSLEIALKHNQLIRQVSIMFSEAFQQAFISNNGHWLEKEFTESDSSIHYLNNAIKSVLDDIHHIDKMGDQADTFFEMKLRELVFVLQMQYNNKGDAISLNGKLDKKLLTAKAHLSTNYIDPPTIKELAKQISLNEFDLKKHFKAAFGITIHHFVIKQRMKKADELIHQRLSVAETSERVGYKSVSHFIETFRKHYGTTPKQAAKLILQQR